MAARQHNQHDDIERRTGYQNEIQARDIREAALCRLPPPRVILRYCFAVAVTSMPLSRGRRAQRHAQCHAFTAAPRRCVRRDVTLPPFSLTKGQMRGAERQATGAAEMRNAGAQYARQCTHRVDQAREEAARCARRRKHALML